MTDANNHQAGQTSAAGSASQSRGSWIEGTAAIVAVLALVAFGILTWVLYSERATEDDGWERLAFIYAGVEAVAFGGAGWLFGREVNRKRAERAEDEADTEKERANDKAQKATEGQALADALRSATQGGGVQPLAGDGRPLQAALHLANRYFPA